jgi:hypothetical protein
MLWAFDPSEGVAGRSFALRGSQDILLLSVLLGGRAA